MAFQLAIELSKSLLRLQPGASDTVEVGITNISSLVQHYQVQFLGLPGPDMTGPPAEPLKLLPKESGRIPVTITLPANSPVHAGQYRVGVLVRSPFQPEVSRTAELTIDVASVAGVTLTAYPEVVEGRGSGRFTLTVHNTGNTPTEVGLAVQDEQGSARVTLQPPTLSIGPLGSGSGLATVKLPGRLTGAEKQVQLRLTATDPRKPGQPATASARMVVKPWLSQAAVNILGGLLTVAAAAVAFLIVGPMIIPPPVPIPSPSPLPTAIETTAEGEDPPDPPTVRIEPEQPVVGQKVTFFGEAEDDVSFAWDLVNPDGISVLEGAATGPSFSFTLTQEGGHLVTLTITRTDGTGSATTTTPFEVGPRPPAVVRIEEGRALAANTTDVLDLECPAGYVPVVGGVADDSNLQGVPYLRASRPEGEREWRLSGRSQSARQATYVTTCIAPLEGQRRAQFREPTAIAGRRLLTVSCPSGTALLGGGISGGTQRDQIALVNELGPSTLDGGATWTAWSGVVETNDPTNATVYAICAPPPAGYFVRAVTTSAVGGEEVLQATSTCEAGQDVLSGGVALLSTAQSPVNGFPATSSFLRIRTSRPVGEVGQPGQGWTSTVDSFTDFGDDVVTVVICAALG